MRNAEKRSRVFAKTLRSRLTDAETILWSRLRRHEVYKFRRQHPIGPYIADFACLAAHVVVEIDGATHGTAREIAHDLERAAYMQRRGWKTVRVWNDDVYRRLNDVLEYIDHEMREVNR